MPVFKLTQLAFVIFNIFLVFLFVVVNRDFCGRVFETNVDRQQISIPGFLKTGSTRVLSFLRLFSF